jgi:molybdenum cofactor guanylyltransferase
MEGLAYAAVVLAGGSGRRLGGRTKPVLPISGRPMLLRVLDAVSGAGARVVVGPPGLAAVLPAGVRLTQEQPAGGGPVAALAAGLDSAGGADVVAVLAADLPLLSPGAVDLLRAHLDAAGGGLDGAVYVDGDGRRQWLCGVWHLLALRRRVGEVAFTAPLAGRSLGELLGPLRMAAVSTPPDEPAPWYDCDTPEELALAHRLHEGDR